VWAQVPLEPQVSVVHGFPSSQLAAVVHVWHPGVATPPHAPALQESPVVHGFASSHGVVLGFGAAPQAELTASHAGT
jgi:hypothetical protein